MNTNEYVIEVCISVVLVCLIIAFFGGCQETERTERAYIDHGYSKVAVPGSAAPVWVAPSNTRTNL